MSKEGYILLWRSLQRNWLWPSGRPYTELEAWLYLLFNVAHSPCRVSRNGKIYTLRIGEMITSIDTLAKEMDWTWRRERNFLKQLENDRAIDIVRSTAHSIVIKLNNYQGFQGKNKAPNTVNSRVINIEHSIESAEKTAELGGLEPLQGNSLGIPINNYNNQLKKSNEYNIEPSAKSKSYKTVVTDDWKPSDKLLKWAADNHPAINIKHEAEIFKSHYLATGTTMANWDQAFRKWILQSLKFSHSKNGGAKEESSFSKIVQAEKRQGGELTL